MTTFADGVFQYGGMPVTPGVPVPFTGTAWFVDPLNGSDGNSGRKPTQAFQTLYRAHEAMTAGKNEVCYLLSDGTTASTARLSKASAQTVDSSVTSGTLVWSKNACHLIGITPPGMVSLRARIAPPTGTYTAATFGSNNFVTVSASGCYFANIQAFQSFSTGNAAEICWTDSGGRNVYANVHFAGIVDAAALAGTTSRSLKISGSNGENVFLNCTMGVDTATRSAANASLEFAGGTPRNIFRGCFFPFMTSAAGVLGILGTGNACVDRTQLFEQCSFVNAIKSTSTQMTALISFTTASPGGLILMRDCSLVGITKFGDTNGLANTYVDGGAPTAATTGLAVNPA